MNKDVKSFIYVCFIEQMDTALCELLLLEYLHYNTYLLISIV